MAQFSTKHRHDASQLGNSLLLLPKGERRHVAQGRMSTFAVVEDFNVIEQVHASGFASGIGFVMHQFLLQCREEGFHWRVVAAIATAAHAACDVVLCERSFF